MTAKEQRTAMTTQKPSILIVEDDDQIRSLLSTILEQSGYSVRLAHDGVAALEELRIEMPDVLLSDLYMPRMTGFELLSVVRQQFSRTRVVAMSSAFSGNEVPAGVTADAFYPKASNVGGLLDIIQNLACPEPTLSRSPNPAYALEL
jgi:CheY-like chemotaxis protein